MDTIKYKASYKLEPYSYCRSSFYDIFPAQMVRFNFSENHGGFFCLSGLYPCKNKDVYIYALS